MKKLLSASLFVLAGAGMAVGQPASYQDSVKIERLFDSYFRQYLTLNPEKGSDFSGFTLPSIVSISPISAIEGV